MQYERFATDTPAELELVAKLAVEAGAYAAVVANHWAEGGAGAIGMYAIDHCYIVVVSLHPC